MFRQTHVSTRPGERRAGAAATVLAEIGYRRIREDAAGCVRRPDGEHLARPDRGGGRGGVLRDFAVRV